MPKKEESGVAVFQPAVHPAAKSWPEASAGQEAKLPVEGATLPSSGAGGRSPILFVSSSESSQELSMQCLGCVGS